MKRHALLVLLVAALVALGVVTLEWRRHVMSERVHEAYRDALRTTTALDGMLDEEVLEVDNGLLRQYDPLVRTTGALRDVLRQLASPPASFDAAAREDLGRAVAQLTAAFRAKEALVERFKSESAILRNSVKFVPVAADEIEKQSNDRDVVVKVEALLRDLLVFEIQPDASLAERAKLRLTELRHARDARIGADPADGEIVLIVAHANAILDRKARVVQLLREIDAARSQRSRVHQERGEIDNET